MNGHIHEHGFPENLANAVIESITDSYSYFTVQTEEVLEKAKELKTEKFCGVYFLSINDEIIYVGQTTNFYSRMYTHKVGQFCEFGDQLKCTFMHVAEDLLNAVESFYIQKLQPRFNKDKVGPCKPHAVRDAICKVLSKDLSSELLPDLVLEDVFWAHKVRGPVRKSAFNHDVRLPTAVMK